MPEHAGRFARLYDQQNENRIADWGGDELFTRMPRRPVVDDAPAPRFRPALVLVDSLDDPSAPAGDRPPRDPVAGPHAAMLERAERLGLSLVDEGPGTTVADASAERRAPDARPDATLRQWDGTFGMPDERAPNGRRTTVITGRPDGAPRPLSLVPAERRRPSRTPAEWVGPRPDRIVAWAFVLGLLLILVAISTADAATL
jgi:hypothetical protein